MSRIKHPSSFDQQLKLVNSINDKHIADGAKSAITPFLIQHNINLTNDVATGDAALQHENNRLLFTTQSQNYNELRNINLAEVLTHVKSAYQFLKSFYSPNYKALGAWGAPIDINGK